MRELNQVIFHYEFIIFTDNIPISSRWLSAYNFPHIIQEQPHHLTKHVIPVKVKRLNEKLKKLTDDFGEYFAEEVANVILNQFDEIVELKKKEIGYVKTQKSGDDSSLKQPRWSSSKCNRPCGGCGYEVIDSDFKCISCMLYVHSHCLVCKDESKKCPVCGHCFNATPSGKSNYY